MPIYLGLSCLYFFDLQLRLRSPSAQEFINRLKNHWISGHPSSLLSLGHTVSYFLFEFYFSRFPILPADFTGNIWVVLVISPAIRRTRSCYGSHSRVCLLLMCLVLILILLPFASEPTQTKPRVQRQLVFLINRFSLSKWLRPRTESNPTQLAGSFPFDHGFFLKDIHLSQHPRAIIWKKGKWTEKFFFFFGAPTSS